MENYSLSIIFLIFIVSAIFIWLAGVTLTKATDTLDTRYNLGDALGGLILLGIASSLPEIAIVYSAARAGHIPVIIGNLIGGITIKTLVLIIFDFVLRKRKPLSYLAGSLLMTLETGFAIILAIIAIFGMMVSEKISLFHISPFTILVIIAWFVGLYIINIERKKQRFNVLAEDADPGRKHHEKRKIENHPFYRNKSNLQVICIFILSAIIIFIAGIYVEHTGTTIADRLGINSGIFAATAIAFVAALPEISTGIESIIIGDNQLAISGIMGGNAFMLVIFLLADIVAQKPILAYSSRGDMVLAILGVLMMLIYAISFIKRPQKRYFGLGIDSIIVIIIYIVGIYVLSYI
jgi:cation:H+ antiporter